MKMDRSKPPSQNNTQKRQRIHNRLKKEQALLQAGLDVFAEKGFDAATTKDIALQAGCAEGLLFNYFGSKKGLLLKCLEASQTSFLSEWQVLWASSHNLEKILENSLHWLTQHYARNQKLVKVSTLYSLLDPEIAASKRSLLLDARLQVVIEGLKRLRLQKIIQADVDVVAMANLLFSIAYGVGFLGPTIYGMTTQEIEQSLQEAVRVLYRGLISQP